MAVPEEIPSKTRVSNEDDFAKNPHKASDKSKRVRDMFTAIAKKYDLNNRLHSFWLDQLWRRRAVKMAKVSKSDNVVDVACGTGDLSMAFYKAGVASVLGIDFTRAMLDLAVVKAENAGMAIEFRQGDAMNLNLPDASFDVVSIAFGIRNVQDPAKAISEFHRILRPEGRLIVLEFSTPPNRCVRLFNNFYTKNVMPISATIIARDKSGAYSYLPKSVETFADTRELAATIEDAGFSVVEQSLQSLGVCTITKAIKS
jgi:demethylmenaquinone methyltransferase/2-methoxy-6-polyprenyl-1,4-benzoquinol methylase